MMQDLLFAVRLLRKHPGFTISASPADGIVASRGDGAGNQIATRPGDGSSQSIPVRTTRVGPRYFSTLGVTVVQGREFTTRDDERAPAVIVVNEVLAKRLWSDGLAAGRTLHIDDRPYEVVGVVRDVQYAAAGQPIHAVAYRCYWQPGDNGAFGKDSRTVVRVAGDAGSMMAAIRREIAAIDPAVPLSEDYPLSRRVAFEFQPVAMARTLISALAVVALCLTAVGLYGVLAFTVSQRTREMAIRMALGAASRDVARLVLREGLLVIVIGIAAGLGIAWASAQLVSSLLYGVSPTDVRTFAAAAAILFVVALAATALPARRASRVSATVALRYE